MKLSEDQIGTMADGISAGLTYYVNLDTGEVEEVLPRELDDYGFDLEEEDSEIDDSLPEWEKEMIADVKAQYAKIDSWKRCVKIDPPESFESFKIMESFVDECVTDERESRFLWQVLSGEKPFANFKMSVEGGEYRERWFEFRLERLMGFVKGKIEAF